MKRIEVFDQGLTLVLTLRWEGGWWLEGSFEVWEE